MLACLACAVACGARAGESTPSGKALDDGRFDGTWTVIVDCANTPDGALGYTFQFDATVKNGYLHGENGRKDQPSWLEIEGRIAANGDARLSAKGITGKERYSVDRVRIGTRYAYHVKAHFDDTQGSGSRIELRKCDLTFRKQ